MSEPTSRLNLIQRAMQRATPAEPAAAAEAALPLPKDSGASAKAHAPVRPENVAPAPQMAAGSPTRAGAVQLDYARLRELRIVAPNDRKSLTYNEFRSIKRRLVPMARDKETDDLDHNRVMITSTLPGEGKTFTSMNLALGLAAETNLEVLLVDADPVMSGISRYFKGETERGLLDLLAGDVGNMDEVLHPCEDLPNLHVLFSGKHNDAAPELFASAAMGEICRKLSRRFPQSIVVIDTPPILASSEPVALVSHVDHLVLVVAAGRAGRHQIEEALDSVSSCASISLLFNKAPKWRRADKQSYYYYYSGNP